ncbi:MAG: FAD:protein FMN transferase [Eubacterium sp.]|nr:FAD:protein FMN transferase [Eubacterium sp.]
MKRLISLILVVSVLITCTSCGVKKDENKPYSASFKCFDTIVSLKVLDNIRSKDFEEVRKVFMSRCNQYDDKFSKTRFGSFVKKLNKNKFFSADKECIEILKDSIKYSNLTDGNFDITVSPIVDLWGIDTSHFKIPNKLKIKKYLNLVDYKQIHFDNNTVHLTKAGSIDLGAIAKGNVTDKMVELLKYMKVKSAIIDMGGNIYAIGSKDGKPFNVGIHKPFSNGELSATVKIKDSAVITAGIDKRYKKRNGKIYPHIIDPKTGYPIDNDLNSVTVISKNATAADALSTGFMVMRLEKGLKLANKTKEIEAVFIDKDNKLHLTDGLKQDGKNITLK